MRHKKRQMEIHEEQMGFDCCCRRLRDLKWETDTGDNFTSQGFFFSSIKAEMVVFIFLICTVPCAVKAKGQERLN